MKSRRDWSEFGASGLIITCLLALPGVASAQDIPGIGTPQQADSTGFRVELPPAPIPLEQAPRRLEQDFDQLRRINRDVVRDDGFVRTLAEIDQILGGVNAILDNFEALPLHEIHPGDLAEYRLSLERQQGRLTNRLGILEKTYHKLEANQQGLDRIRLEWTLTRDSIHLDTLAISSFEVGIDRVLLASDSVDVQLQTRLAELLEIGEDLSISAARMDDALLRIEESESTNRKMLLVRDAPPLWRPVAVLSEGRPIVGDVSSYVAKDFRAFRKSLGADRDRVLIHLLVLFLTLALFLRLRRGTEEWPDDPILDTARSMLSKPIAAAGLSALLATSFIYPHASFLVFEAALLLSLIPAVWLLPPAVFGETRTAVYWLFALFLASRLATFFPPDGIARRLAVLGLAIGAAAWAIELLRVEQKREGTLIRGLWRGLLKLGLKISVIVAVLSIALNAAGWVDLAEVLIEGLIPSAYLALVVWLGALVFRGVARGIAYSRLMNRSRAFSDNRERVLRLFAIAIRLVALLTWIWGTISWFGIDRELFRRLGDLFTFEFSIGAVGISIGRIVLFLLILWLATWVGRIIRVLLRDDILPRLSVPPGQADAWSTLAQWATLLIGFLFAAASAGIGGGQMTVLAGALGVGIGFGLQNIVNNFVSGFILIFEQPIKVADKIEISSLSLLGEVRKIGIRSSTVRTFDGADVVVPNSNLIQSEVINWTLSDMKRRVQAEVGVAYGTDPKHVLELLLSVARSSPRVLTHPEPVALFTGFGDSSLNFVLRVWSATFDESIRLRSEIAVEIYSALNAAGITIPFPQRDLHVRSIDPGAATAVSGQGPETEPQAPAPDRQDPTPDLLREPGSLD